MAGNQDDRCADMGSDALGMRSKLVLTVRDLMSWIILLRPRSPFSNDDVTTSQDGSLTQQKRVNNPPLGISRSKVPVPKVV